MTRTRTLAVVGTLNRPAPYFPAARGAGLSLLEFDASTGHLSPLSETSDIDNPSYVAVHPTNGCAYATSEVFGWHEGVVSAYRIDTSANRLHYINKQPTLGSITAYAGFDRTGRWLLVANYRMGEDGLRSPRAAVVYPIEGDGGIGAPVSSVVHAGTGPDPDRQEGPHPHCVLASPDNRFVLISDLGIDRIVIYPFDATIGHLDAAVASCVTLAPGAGPRHLAFGASGEFLYVINELNNTICMLSWDAATGALALVQTVPTLPAGWRGDSHCADLHISADGRFLYGSNRGHDSIAIFAIDRASGNLALVGHQPTGGSTPRNFALDPSGRFLLAANQNGDSIVTFGVDPTNGRLHETSERAMIGTPMCVKLATSRP